MGKGRDILPAPGKRTYFLCAHCHDPHDPKFKPLKPEPPPYQSTELSKMEIKRYTRREFIRNFSLTALGGMSLPLLSSCTKQEAEDFLQKRFRGDDPRRKETDHRKAGSKDTCNNMGGNFRSAPRKLCPIPSGATASSFPGASDAGDASMPV